MESRIKVFGHSAHQAFVVVPAGLLIGAVGFDVAASFVDTSASLYVTAYHLLGAGIVTGLLAAPVGMVDWLAIPSGTRAKRIGRMHASVMVVALAVFSVSWFLRRGNPDDPSIAARVLALAAFAVVSLGAWFGGELVSRLGVGVSPDAGLNASNSMKSKHADMTGGRDVGVQETTGAAFLVHSTCVKICV